MSMTVCTEIKGVTDLDLMMKALKAMDISVRAADSRETVRGRRVLAVARIRGKRVGIVNHQNTLTLVGDTDWKLMKDQAFANRLRQQYGVAAVKKKVKEMRYTVETITSHENGDIRIVARGRG